MSSEKNISGEQSILVKKYLGGLPASWGYSDLNGLCKKIFDGAHQTPTYTSTGIPFLRVTDIQNNKINLANVKHISELEHKNLTVRNKTEKGDILLSKNGTIGLAKIVDWDWEFSTFVSLATIKLDKQNPRLEPHFLCALLSSPILETQIKNQSKQGTVTNLHLEEIESFLIPLPPLPEQQKIAAILRTWDEAIEKYQAHLAILGKKRKFVIQKFFAPKRWPLATMVDVADIIVSNVDKKSHAGEQIVRLCNYMDVFYNRYITGDLNFMEAGASERELATYALKKGDAVFTKDSETPEEIAMCASVEADVPSLLCGYHLAIARPKEGKILGSYLAEAINSPRVHHQFYRAANGATRFGLTRGDIDKVELPLPPMAQQEKVMAALRECDREKLLTERKISNLQSQKRGLMQKLLTGAWRVSPSKEAAA